MDEQMNQQLQMRKSRKDYYQILDLPRDCESDEIKKSYKKLALRFHPDKNKDSDAKIVFNQISEAYTCLNNENKRQQYDLKHKNIHNTKSSGYRPKDFFYDSKEPSYEEKQREQLRKSRMEEQRKMKEEMRQKFEEAFQKFSEAANIRKNKKNEQDYATRMKKRYQEEKKQKQKRNRMLEAQSNKRKGIIAVIFFMFLYFGLNPLLRAFSQKPLFSLNKTKIYQHKMETTILNIPYYVNQQFLSEQTSQLIRNQINEKVNRKFIAGLKKQCQQAQKNKDILQSKAKKHKNKKSRQQLVTSSRQIDLRACQKLFNLMQQFPEQMNALGY